MRRCIVSLSLIFSLATAVSHTPRLWNGKSWINTTYHEPLRSLAPRDGNTPCTGSSQCKLCWGCRRMKLEKTCLKAERLIHDDDEFSTGGEKQRTGVCEGGPAFTGCGIFLLKGIGHPPDSECRITGREMSSKVAEIRSQGCATCGRLLQTGDHNCEVVIDFVRGCREL